MTTPRRRIALALAALALVAAGWAAWTYFAPTASTHVDEALDEDAFTTLASGAFSDGAPGHTVSGTVRILRASDGSHALRFEDYEATAGPDVFLYLTREAGADTTAAVEGDGVRVLVPGGADGGEATLRGDFSVPLPAGMDYASYAGLSVWCDRFNVLFGHAPLV